MCIPLSEVSILTLPEKFWCRSNRWKFMRVCEIYNLKIEATNLQMPLRYIATPYKPQILELSVQVHELFAMKCLNLEVHLHVQDLVNKSLGLIKDDMFDNFRKILQADLVQVK
jgi:hypothetical protein